MLKFSYHRHLTRKFCSETQNETHRLADLQSRHRGIMITSPVRQQQLPIVHMNMLHLGTPIFDGIGDKNMIELFIFVVEDVGISFDWGDIRGLVDIRDGHSAVRSEHGTSLQELVVIASDDDVGVWIFGEDGFGECLIEYYNADNKENKER